MIGRLDFGICTGKENEAQKEDPGEEFRNPGVDDQEPPLAAPLLRIGHLRDRPSWYSRGCGIDRLLFFLCGEVSGRVSGEIGLPERGERDRYSTTVRRNEICVTMNGVSWAASLGRVGEKDEPFSPDRS